jgi:autotransporter passenger strand-loop-strand repeat protein
VLSGTSLANATQYDFAYASGGIIENGGFQLVAPAGAGIALGMEVQSGGEQFIAGGGTASGTIIDAGGAQVVRGTDQGALISGTQYVNGVASGAVVATGGYELVNSGGTISGATISGGTIEIASGGLTGPAPITFAAAGELILDASVLFSGTVAGFGSASMFDTIDFADIPYVASGGSATIASWTQLTSGPTASGTLVISEGGKAADITLLGQYIAGNFSLSSDNHGGTLVTDPPVVASTDANSFVLTTARHA